MKEKLILLCRPFEYVAMISVGMDFCSNKCAVIVMKRSKRAKSVGIELPDRRGLKGLEKNNDGYKYLGVLEVDDVKHESIKQRLTVRST